jgi:hypothetical protein
MVAMVTTVAPATMADAMVVITAVAWVMQTTAALVDALLLEEMAVVGIEAVVAMQAAEPLAPVMEHIIPEITEAV